MSTSYISFKLNCGYYLWMLYKKEVDSHSKSKPANELLAELREKMIVCQENLHHNQELPKQAHDKRIKPQNYNSKEKVWLNSKYIKTKHNHKLKAKFFGLFWVFHLVKKQAYKLKLPKSWRIHDIFYVSLLEHENTRKRLVDKEVR